MSVLTPLPVNGRWSNCTMTWASPSASLPGEAAPSWKLAAVLVSPEDLAAGVTIHPLPADGVNRVRLQSPTSRAVRWELKFAPSLSADR